MIITIHWFDDEDFKEFSEKINNVREWEKVTIFIDSGWGSTLKRDMYLHVINNLQNVEIVWIQISSSAFDVFYKANCKKTLTPSAFWMVHQSSWDVTIWHGSPNTDFAKFQINYQKKWKWYDFLTKKERKIFDKWWEVWMDYDRLSKIFKQ